MTEAAFNLSGVDRLGIIGDTHANPRWLNPPHGLSRRPPTPDLRS